MTSKIRDQKSYIRFCDTEVIYDLSKNILDAIVGVVGIEAKLM